MPIYITIDRKSPASSIYHDHSYFIRYESTIDKTNRDKSTVLNNNTNNQSQLQPKSSLPSVQVLNQLLLDHQQKSSSTIPIDFTDILHALLTKPLATTS
jgi:hypothetical protein